VKERKTLRSDQEEEIKRKHLEQGFGSRLKERRGLTSKMEDLQRINDEVIHELEEENEANSVMIKKSGI